MADAELILRRLGRMRAKRAPHESIWRACFDATYPERGEGLEGNAGGDFTPGANLQGAQTKRADLLDPTGTDGARLLCSSVVSGTTPSNAKWLAFDAGDESDDERRWLDHAAQTMWETIHAANYDAEKYEAVLDSVCAGWFVLYIDEDPQTGALQFQQWPLSQCFVDSSKAGGTVDIVYRCYKLTAAQAVSEFGEDKVGEKVRECAFGDKPDQLFDFVHAVEPRSSYAKGSRLGSQLPVQSCHILVETKAIVREGGYHEMPVVVPRWRRFPGSPYGVGPVFDALPAIRQLNELLRLESAALSRAAAGVYVAVDDGVMNPRNVRVRGGSVIVANDVDSIKPLPSGADFNVTFSKAETLRAEIRRLLLADQLQPQDGPAMTATEVHVRVALIRQLLGPLFGRFQAEDLAVTIDRVFGLLYRRGRPEIGGRPGPLAIDDAPETLTNVPLSVRYLSPLARAQQLEEVTAIERTSAYVGSLVAAGKQDAFDLLDVDEAVRAYGKGTGAPNAVIRSKKELAELREAKQRAQQEAAQAEQAAQVQTMAAEAAFTRAAAA